MKVTPRAGVWIETEPVNSGSEAAAVTPRAGVWIETHLIAIYFDL